MMADYSALTLWLASVLRPLCDADPEALTKYVLALMNKDLSESDLRKSLLTQLEIFLQENTTLFVEKLLNHLREQESGHEVMPTNIPGSTDFKDEIEFCVDKTSGAGDSDDCEIPLSPISDTTESALALLPDYLDSEEESRSCVEKENVDTTGAKTQYSDIGYNRSPSGTNSTCEGTDFRAVASPMKAGQVLRKKEKVEVPERHSGSQSSDSSSSSMKRRPSYTKRRPNAHISRARQDLRRSPIRRHIRRDQRLRRRTRSPIRNRSASPPMRKLSTFRRQSVINSKSRSRSGSISPVRNRVSVDKNFSRVPSPDDDSLLEHISKFSVKSVIVKPDSGVPQNNDDTVGGVPVRCRDFDEKGVCMRGELCAFDHGSDPVVLEDVIPNSDSGETSTSTNFGTTETVKPVRNFLNQFTPVVRPTSGEYYPESPSMVPPPFGWNPPPRHFRQRHINGDHHFAGSNGVSRPHFIRPYGIHDQRQLISIPVDGIHPQGSQPILMGNRLLPGARIMCRPLGPRSRGVFDYRRLGLRPPMSSGNNCLEVRKVPKHLNKIETLANHFSRFGSVVSIQIGFNRDVESALVTFSDHSEALRAYRSTDAVLNNRFIKTFWHTREIGDTGSDRTSPGPGGTKRPGEAVKECSSPVNFGQEQSAFAPYITSRKESKIPRITKDLCEIQKPVCESSAGFSWKGTRRISPSIQVADASTSVSPTETCNSKIADLQKRRQDMINTQIEEQKKLISTLETNRERMTTKQKEELFSTLKSLQKSCEELKANLETTSAPPSNGLPKICSKDEILKKILDAELEMYARERTGKETVDLEKRILILRSEETFSLRC